MVRVLARALEWDANTIIYPIVLAVIIILVGRIVDKRKGRP